NPNHKAAAALAAAAALCLIATGALLWQHFGPTLFNALILAPLAWCF
ncbi:hypothetical protein HB375_15590, partial [Microvirga sp. c23x22]|nr:hypothetical protein [Microvirga terricola]